MKTNREARAAAKCSPRTSGRKRDISLVEEVIAADGSAFDQLAKDAPGTFDEDEELGSPRAGEGGEKRPHLDLGVEGHAIASP